MCSVGMGEPVSICALSATNMDLCQLEFFIPQTEGTVFIVSGPQGVYLSGYYIIITSGTNTDETEHHINVAGNVVNNGIAVRLAHGFVMFLN